MNLADIDFMGNFLFSPIKMALTIALSVAVVSGCSGLPQKKLSPAETAMWTTYPISSEHVMGTGFIVAVKIRAETNCYWPVVITTKHMLQHIGEQPFYVPLRMIESDGTFSFLAVRIVGKRNRPFYVSHPNFDVAAFPLPLPSGLESKWHFKFLEERALTPGKSRVGENVMFLGFPEGLPGTPDLFPVLRAGRLASYDPEHSADRIFLVNADVYPGDSGAPIFVASKRGKPNLIGMVIERVELREGERSPIALAVDADVIRETLDMLIQREGF